MKYMLISTGVVEETCVLLIAPLREIQLHGQLLKAIGKEIVAPPLEGRGFSCLTKPQLQYLYWNTCKEAPPEDYGELIAKCLAVIDKLEVDPTPLAHLERETAKLRPVESSEPGEEKPKGSISTRPGKLSVTGFVWEIADKLYEANGNQIPDRKAVIAECVKEEINPATASTQYGKWKASKTVQPGS